MLYTHDMFAKIRNFVKTYPHPVFVLAGLIAGVISYLIGEEQIAHWIWFATLVLGGAPIAFKTVRGMFQGKFASDIVAMLAIITAVIMDQAFAGAIVVLMQSGGEALEAYGLRRASSSLNALLERAPRMARRKKEGGLEEIDVEQVAVGDILVVRPGDLIPVDGTIVAGEAEVDEAAITGEPLAHAKAAGAKVMSGSIAVSGAFEMRADKVSQESQYAKIVVLVQQAQEQKAPIERLADRYAIYFTPLTLIISALGYFITRDPHTILAVLVVATPCPLILATPVAVISGINRAAQEGIIVKGGAPIEEIGRCQIAVFDKTGTITYGTPFVEEVISFNGTPVDEILFKAGSLEQFSSHPVAQAIATKAKKQFKELAYPKHFQETPGRGVEGEVNGQRVFLGSQVFLEELLGKAIFNNHEETYAHLHGKGKLFIFVVIDKTLSGVVVFSDRIRPGVPMMIQRLHDLGIKDTLMLTGDSSKNAAVIAEQAQIRHVKAELLPEQKVEAIKKLREKYDSVLMVGDGINDAPALATATVGIAMGAQGTAISAAAADIVLLVDDVTKVGEAVFIGQRMVKIAKQGIFIGMGLSLVLMLIAAGGYIPPAVGALLQEVIDAVVILNALRAR
jgi:heavy metal translocating P-type ATPase